MMPKSVLIPIVLVLCVIGAYALSNSMNDVYVLPLFCVIGYAMVKARIPLAPLILGVVLGDQIEVNLIQAVIDRRQPVAVRHAADFRRDARRVRAVDRARGLAAPARNETRRRGRRGRGHGFLGHCRHARACRGHPRLFLIPNKKGVDGRDKPGHDTERHTRALPVGRGAFPYL